ncbi:MAG: hypothetical protein P4L51_28530 [Puia sp.]|nr:hypothetical protein [Puia sp.]
MRVAKMINRLFSKRVCSTRNTSGAAWYVTKRCEPRENSWGAGENKQSGAKLFMLENGTRYNFPGPQSEATTGKDKASEKTSSIVVRIGKTQKDANVL